MRDLGHDDTAITIELQKAGWPADHIKQGLQGIHQPDPAPTIASPLAQNSQPAEQAHSSAPTDAGDTTPAQSLNNTDTPVKAPSILSPTLIGLLIGVGVMVVGTIIIAQL